MLMTKKNKIRKYLEAVGKDNWSPFDRLLSDALDGTLSGKLQELGIAKPEICIDFLDDYQCIGVQGKYQRCYVDIQIEKTEFSIGCDPVEPDAHAWYPLEGEALFFAAVSRRLSQLE